MKVSKCKRNLGIRILVKKVWCYQRKLKEAVKAVGTSAAAVQKYLGK
jgi:Protein of unknown function (DUF3606).